MEHSRVVGIDVSKDHLDAHVRPTSDAFRNDATGLATLSSAFAPTSHRRRP